MNTHTVDPAAARRHLETTADIVIDVTDRAAMLDALDRTRLEIDRARVATAA